MKEANFSLVIIFSLFFFGGGGEKMFYFGTPAHYLFLISLIINYVNLNLNLLNNFSVGFYEDNRNIGIPYFFF